MIADKTGAEDGCLLRKRWIELQAFKGRRRGGKAGFGQIELGDVGKFLRWDASTASAMSRKSARPR
jgi:hypothetical protein